MDPCYTHIHMYLLHIHIYMHGAKQNIQQNLMVMLLDYRKELFAADDSTMVITANVDLDELPKRIAMFLYIYFILLLFIIIIIIVIIICIIINTAAIIFNIISIFYISVLHLSALVIFI